MSGDRKTVPRGTALSLCQVLPGICPHVHSPAPSIQHAQCSIPTPQNIGILSTGIHLLQALKQLSSIKGMRLSVEEIGKQARSPQP